jgi:hypothetical protein
MAFFGVPTSWRDPEEFMRKLANALNDLGNGRSRAYGTVTLATSSATTTLTDARIGTDSVLTFMPTTSNAAAGVGVLYVTGGTDGSCTLNHANNAQADRTYHYQIQG